MWKKCILYIKMSDEGLKLENDLCRCCQAEGRFKSLSERPRGEETFAETLKIVLDIELKPVSDPLDRKMFAICETCIKRLEDADNFKQQVLGCERVFQQLYTGHFIKVAEKDTPVITIKEEISDDDDFSTRNDDAVPEIQDEKINQMLMFELPIKEQDPEIRESKSMVDTKPVPLRRTERKRTVPRKQEVPAGKKLKPVKKKRKTLDEKIQAVLRKGLMDDEDKEVNEEENAPGGQFGRRNVYHLQAKDYTVVDQGMKCTYCDKILIKKNTLRFHIKTVHMKMAKYTCEVCKETFTTVAPFTRHKYEKHNIDDRLQCNACENSFNSKIQLQKHIKSFHMLGEVHKCKNCDYQCFSIESLYKHNFKHKTVKDYHCKFCKKSFLRKTNLDLHERIHTGDRRKVCKECGQAFVQKASLNYHMAKYHPGVPF